MVFSQLRMQVARFIQVPSPLRFSRVWSPDSLRTAKLTQDQSRCTSLAGKQLLQVVGCLCCLSD